MQFYSAYVSQERPAAGSQGSVLERLRRDLLTGAFPPSEKLRVMKLASRYGVAGTTVREALSRLVSEGLVTRHESRGFRAAEISLAGLIDLTRALQIVDGEAFRLSIERGDHAWEGEIVGLFHRLSRMPADGAYRAEWEALHRSFHQALISACGISTLLEISGRLYDLGQRYRFIMLDVMPPEWDLVGEHRALMEVALDRDPKRGQELICHHLELTAQIITATWEEGQKPRFG